MIHKTPCYGRNESFDGHPFLIWRQYYSFDFKLYDYCRIWLGFNITILQVFSLQTLHLNYTITIQQST